MMVETGSPEPSTLFHQIMENLAEGVAITNVRGQLVFANQALEQLLGYEPGELVGKSWTLLFSGSLRRELPAVPCDAPGRHRTRLLHKGGSEIPATLSNFALSEGGHDAGTLSTFTDLRNPGQRAFTGDYEVAPTATGQEIAGIVHELNNSLSILTLQTQMLQRREEPGPALRDNLVVIQDETVRMATMVESLRAAADPHTIQLKPTDINMLLVQTLDLQKPFIENAGIRVDLDLDTSLPTIEADPRRLQQVFVNLINNARQAMEGSQDSGHLAICTCLVESEDAAPRIQVRFADDGPGIPPEVMPHIFKPFYTTKTSNGMGMGLPICRQILEKHQGRIWAEDNLNAGAAMILELPVVDARPTERGLPARASEGHHAHILVVDDEPEVARYVGTFLQQEGFTVTTATGARKALTLLDRTEVDLIISDLSMPQMGGRQFWTQVHERKPDLARRIIFSTGDSSAKRSLAFLQSCGCAWIRKPFEPKELLRLIAQRLAPESEPTLSLQEVAEAA